MRQRLLALIASSLAILGCEEATFRNKEASVFHCDKLPYGSVPGRVCHTKSPKEPSFPSAQAYCYEESKRLWSFCIDSYKTSHNGRVPDLEALDDCVNEQQKLFPSGFVRQGTDQWCAPTMGECASLRAEDKEPKKIPYQSQCHLTLASEASQP